MTHPHTQPGTEQSALADFIERCEYTSLDDLGTRNIALIVAALRATPAQPAGMREALEEDLGKLAPLLVIAWNTYMRSFGEAPHGTLKQMRALLRLMPALPAERPAVAQDVPDPHSDAGAGAMQERCAAMMDNRAEYFERAKGHRDWTDAARSYRESAKQIRALPLPLTNR